MFYNYNFKRDPLRNFDDSAPHIAGSIKETK